MAPPTRGCGASGSRLVIRFSSHARTRMGPRGTSEEEIAEVLAKGLPDVAGAGRQAKSLIYPFGRTWSRRTYEQKKVRVIYIHDGEDTVVVTVYVYQWELVMKLTYDAPNDLLYIAFEEGQSPVRNEDAAEGVVLDITEDGHIAGIEILDASKVLDLRKLLPIEYAATVTRA